MLRESSLSGALRLIEHLVATGVRAAIGHSEAQSSLVADAVAAGATLSTHLGNGCATVLPRHPNLLWAQLAEDRLLASLIVDGPTCRRLRSRPWCGRRRTRDACS